MSLFLGADVGTSGARAGVFDDHATFAAIMATQKANGEMPQ
jgi:sugar (pentulose or hexulose) kinase